MGGRAATTGSKPKSDRLWPLVGRDRELAAVLSAYRRMRQEHRARGGGWAGGRMAGVVLLGAPGVGKTRLAGEAVTRLTAAGSPTTWVTATRSAAAVPLGALAHLLPPTDRPGAAALAAMAARFAATGGAPPVLAVDDAHLLDDASAALIHHLATSGRAFVLLTARAGEPAPDAATAVWTEGQAEQRVDLPPLDDAAQAELLAHALDGPLDPISLRELRRLCAGNPLLMREVLRAGRSTGALHKVDGVWRWTGIGYVTERLADVVQSRLGGLDAELQEVVEPLACGGRLPVPMLEALCGRDALARAEQRRLVVVENAGSRLVARLAHPVHADAVRASLPRYRQVQLARRLTEAIESTPMRRGDDVLHAARWRLLAGLPARPDQALAAVRCARVRADLGLAEELARAARRAGGGWLAELELAEVLLARGRYPEAAGTLPRLPDDCDHEVRVRWRIADQQIRYWGSGTAAPQQDAAGEPVEDGTLSWLFLLDGQCAEGTRMATAALRPKHLGPQEASWAASAAIVGTGLLGRYAQAITWLRRGLAVAEDDRAAHRWGKTQVGVAGCMALLACGRLAEAAELAAHGYREALELTDVIGGRAAPMVGAWAAARGVVARNQGRAQAALAALREATVLLQEWPTFRLTRVYLAQRAAACAVAGDLAGAVDWLRRADDSADSPGRLFDAWVERDRAWVVAATGDLAAAAGHARHAAGLAARTGQPTIEAVALYDVVRFSGADGGRDARDRLAKMAAAGGIVSTFAAAAAALGAGDGAAALDQAAGTLGGLGHLVYAAEAAAQAYHRHAKAGRRVRAHASRGRATELLRGCGTVRTHLLDLTGAENSLTVRELHVARLAAAGQSGPSIAAKLGLSVRTVNNHLGRVYSKLGVTGRTELAGMITSLSPGSAPR